MRYDFFYVYNKLVKTITNNRWLNKLTINKAIILKFVDTIAFKNNLNKILYNNDFSCNSILYLLQDILGTLSQSSSPKDWLMYIYEYTISKSFPEAISIELHNELITCCEFYLRTLSFFCELQKKSNDNTWQSLCPMNFLTEEEIIGLESSEEYKRFLKAFKNDYVYEMMKLSKETMNFSTLDHVCGVHYLSLYIGRQLKLKNIHVDLGRVSGSAAGHDVGKYGCKNSELKQVPHLHYYYTDEWFKKYNMPYIGNIAINHSTWDLELDNLPIESLILIYSDFRVKYDYSQKSMRVFSLEDSFYVIMNKLEDLDDNKIMRYKKVYSKLKDFEDFIKSIGISVDILNSSSSIDFSNNKDSSLLFGTQIIQRLKFNSINHNINLMYLLRNDYSLQYILELARSEKDWKNLREYIRVFEDYSTYLTQNQKLQTLKFLYENLTHPEDDIRRHCAELIGTIIAIYDEDYRKEIPKNVQLKQPNITSATLLNDYIKLMLFPGKGIIELHKFNIGYSLSFLINSLFKNCKSNLSKVYLEIIMNCYNTNLYKGIDNYLFLLESAKFIPLNERNYSYFNNLFNFTLQMLKKKNSILRIAALETTIELIHKAPNNCNFIDEVKNILNTRITKKLPPIEHYLIYKLSNSINNFVYEIKLGGDFNDFFLNNLKTATNWIVKRNQINLLLNYSINNKAVNFLHIAIHFCNLLKVSAIETVRNSAGNAILDVMPYLSITERNEVAIELLRALEIEGNRFTEYIPSFLGQIILWLQPKELDEIIDDLTYKIKISNSNLKSLILKTISVCVSNYPNYSSRFIETAKQNNNRLLKLLSILLNGVGDYNMQVKQSALIVIGKDIFGSRFLKLKEKEYIFKLIIKKLLTLLNTDIKLDNNILLFLTRCSCLNHIYSFVSDFSFENGELVIDPPKRVAFFPGTFDPFSLSHKQIALTIRNLGFEVYLSVDEFSWSKRTLPSLIRKNILNLSLCSELNIYIFPNNIPINIGNSKDLIKLKECFKSIDLYITIGSDVILNASSYKSTENFSILNFPHIIFERGKSKHLKESIKNIKAEVLCISLPSKYSSISSTQIRKYIDENKDISSLIDPMAEQYILENGFYQREPQNKLYVKPINISVEIVKNLNESVFKNIINNNKLGILNKLKLDELKASRRIALIKNLTNNEILGFCSFYWSRASKLYEDFQDINITAYIRENSIGRVVIVDSFYVKPSDNQYHLEQIMLTECLAFCIAKDYQYAIFSPISNELYSSNLDELLKSYGFKELSLDNSNKKIFAVNMTSPCILNLDIENVLKEPFRNNPKIKKVIYSCRKKLLKSINNLYPGELVLPVDINYLNQKLINKICEENKVPTEIVSPRKLGPHMCVPYGDVLNRYIIPNTVTKGLHTEKLYDPDMKNFSIGEYPYYLPLDIQIKLLKSFNKPVILVDNILHKGYRIKALDPLIKKENIEIKKIIVGIMSGRGKDLMDFQNQKVSSIYFIPSLKLWFNENSLYPFIGGDALWRGNYPKRNLIPSINSILPYTWPTFIKNASSESIFNFSKVCIENSIQLLKCIEEEYHILYERNLNLYYLGQVFTNPRCIDHGRNMQYDLTLSPSYYLKNDLEILNRFKNMIDNI